MGRQLAKRLGLSFSDSDQLIEKRIGESIRVFFAREGEESFRELEASVIKELVASPPCVLSTGGGVVVRSENRRMLRSHCRVVYLHSSPAEVFRRLRHDRTRPLLQVEDPLARLKDLYAVRDPLYRETAHFVIETGRPSVAMLVNMITMQLELGEHRL